MTLSWSGIFGRIKEKSTVCAPIELLSRVPFFEELNRRELAIIEQFLHQREYQKGECIFRQGERGLGMYIIQSGVVAVISEPDNHELSELKGGDFLGEVALLDDSFRSATIRAKTDCTVFGLFQPDLAALIDRDHRLGLKVIMRIARHVCQRLRQTNEKVVSLSAELAELKKSDSCCSG
jgi:CRP/FNR family transcriptional regulator, cyclic AMP receptor protein